MKIYSYIGKTFFIMALSMLCSFFCTILLAKEMTYESFGFFSLIKSILPLLSMIALSGFDKAYIRRFANKEVKNVSVYLILVIVFISLIVSFIFTTIYEINQYYLYILIGTVFGAINLFLTSYFRLINNYSLAQFILSGHKVIFFILVFSFLYYDFLITDRLSVILLSISIFIPSIFYSFYQFNTFKNKRFSNVVDFFQLYQIGILFFILNILNLIIMTIDKWIIPILFNNEILGIFSALGFIYVTIFTMFSSAIGYVLFPELIKKNIYNLKSLILSISAIPVILSLIFLFFGNQINDLAYNGKYNYWQNSSINIYFVIIGIAQFFNSIIHWIILSKGNHYSLILYIKYMLVQILTIILMALIYFNQVSSDINHITFFMMLVVLFKLVLNILVVNKIRGPKSI